MALKLDPFGRLLRSPVSAARPACIVCRGQIRDDERSMTVRGSVQVHQRCATYRMRQVESGYGRFGYPPR